MKKPHPKDLPCTTTADEQAHHHQAKAQTYWSELLKFSNNFVGPEQPLPNEFLWATDKDAWFEAELTRILGKK